MVAKTMTHPLKIRRQAVNSNANNVIAVLGNLDVTWFVAILPASLKRWVYSRSKPKECSSVFGPDVHTTKMAMTRHDHIPRLKNGPDDLFRTLLSLFGEFRTFSPDDTNSHVGHPPRSRDRWMLSRCHGHRLSNS
jgi:hypothetical protein